jgi:hypothetical protein
LEGKYKAKSVRRVEIPKPDGGVRLLPWERKFLGFSFYRIKGEIRIRIHPKSIKKVKEKIRTITSRSNAWSMKYRHIKLRQVITGWVILARTFTKKILKKLGYVSFTERYAQVINS